jgi:hypothetical protein
MPAYCKHFFRNLLKYVCGYYDETTDSAGKKSMPFLIFTTLWYSK